MQRLQALEDRGTNIQYQGMSVGEEVHNTRERVHVAGEQQILHEDKVSSLIALHA